MQEFKSRKIAYMWVASGNKYNSIHLQARLLTSRLKSIGVIVELMYPKLHSRKQTLTMIINSPSVVIWHYGGFDPWLLPFLFSSKVIFVYHNITPAHYFWRTQPLVGLWSLLGRLQLRLIPRNRKWIAVSRYNSIELQRMGFTDIDLCPCIVDAPKTIAWPKSSRPSLLYTGRIAPNKNCIELLEHAAIAADKVSSPIRLTLVGDVKRGCKYGDDFQKKLRELSAHPWLTIIWKTGGVDDQELDRLYSEEWIYVSMSLHEGFGLPVCEAVARGTPALYVECGGTESIMNQFGMVRVGERANYWLHLIELLKSQTSRNTLLQIQLNTVQNYTFPRVNEIIQHVYSPLLKRSICLVG